MIDSIDSPLCGDSNEKQARISMNFVKEGWGMQNEVSKFNSRSQKQLLTINNPINQETEIMNLSQTVGEELSKFIQNLRDDTNSFIQQSQINMIEIKRKREEFLNSNNALTVKNLK